jgi:hypothetical protein
MIERKAALDAFFDIVRNVDGIVTASRKLKLWSNVPREERPALFMTTHSERYVRKGEGIPAKVTISGMLFLYTWTDVRNPNIVPADQQDALLDAIHKALQPKFPYQEQTLGGLVQHAWIEDEIQKDPGDIDDNGDGVAIIPFNILFP